MGEGEWKVTVDSSADSDWGVMAGRSSSVRGVGEVVGRSRHWTSALGKGLSPRPGTRTNVAPLLPSVVPTAMPFSEEGEKC